MISAFLVILTACGSGEEVAVDLPLSPPTDSATEAEPAQKTADKKEVVHHSPTVKVRTIDEVTPEEWKEVIDAIINTKTKLMLDNHIYVIVNENGTFPFWENNNRLISLGFPHGEELDKNPFLLKYLREFPSSLTENDFSLLEKSTYSAEEQAELMAHRAQIEAALPYVITDSIGEFDFVKVETSQESGKYGAIYRKDEEEYRLNIYDIIEYKDGSYDDINPEDIFGTERMPDLGPYVYHDEFSIFWRNQNHMFDLDISEDETVLDTVTPIVNAYHERFPSEKF